MGKKDNWSKLKFVLISHGLKNNPVKGIAVGGETVTVGYTVPKADLYLDCRGILDGSVSGFSNGETGDNGLMQDAVYKANPATITSFQRIIEDSLSKIPIRRSGMDDPYAAPYVVCFMCAHGIHRSRSAKNLLAILLTKAGHDVEVK